MKCCNSSRYLIKNLISNAVYVSLLVILLWQSAPLHAKITEYPKVAPNVPYSEVAKLVPSPPKSQISYGVLADQKILFWPSIGEKQNNTVIFIHGGCWLAQFDINHSLTLSSALAERGFDVYSIEYRRTGNGGEWPVALQDIQLALRVIQHKLAGDNDVHEEPVSILGHSAGGHLAALAAFNIAPDTFTSVHLFGLAPIIDIVAYAEGDNNCQTATPSFMGGTPRQQAKAYKKANPLSYKKLFGANSMASSSLKSAIMMVGNNDTIVPQGMAQHPDAEFIVIDKAGHFDWIHPGSDAFNQLVNKLSAVSKLN